MDWTIPADSRIGRVALRVNDLSRMVEFYETVIGLSVHNQGEGRAVLGVDDTGILVLNADPDAPARRPAQTGLFHMAFRFPGRSALADALHRVEEAWEMDGAADHRVSEALYLSDPEDNGIELYRDRPRREWPERGGRVEMPSLRLDVDALRGESAGSPDAPAGTTVGHVHLEVSDIAAARRFYVDTLGFTVRRDMGAALFVAAGEYHHHIGLNTWNNRSEPAAGRGLDWFEIEVPDEGTVAVLQERCDRVGEDGFRVSDPDGMEIRVRPSS